MTDPSGSHSTRPLIEAHPRRFEENRYVYPVLSRRAGGISIGVNLNLDKRCNFDCIYCQVDRAEMGEKEFIEIDRLAAELDATVQSVTSGRIFEAPPFSATPPSLRRLNDMAFSGDGEPTTYRNFDQIVAAAAGVRRRHRLAEVKLVLITNASMFHRDRVRRGLEMLDANNGEIWAKLDAGTEAYYRRVARSSIPLERILDNLLDAARRRPIVIQALFMRINGQPPPVDEQQAFCDRLNEISFQGGRIKRVQIYTVARPPAERWVTALERSEVDALADRVRQQTGLEVARYYGRADHP
jgi:wyosine [tRNA(Phe)-imidazoG37] synthetase (radical SAM superfamily)